LFSTILEGSVPLVMDLFKPQSIILYGGLTLLLFVVFAETGLFFGFFLPGDSLLFVAGLFANTKYLDVSVWLLMVLLIIAAVSGTTVGYYFGKWFSRHLETRKENFFYKRKYMDMTQAFYDKYGMTAFILGRFLPVIRTFVPILAGMVKIEFAKFFFYNVIGASIWIIVLVMAGYWLGNIFPQLADNLGYVVIGMIVLTSIPLVTSWLKLKKNVE
jgi:membrane-associated protein